MNARDPVTFKLGGAEFEIREVKIDARVAQHYPLNGPVEFLRGPTITEIVAVSGMADVQRGERFEAGDAQFVVTSVEVDYHRPLHYVRTTIKAVAGGYVDVAHLIPTEDLTTQPGRHYDRRVKGEWMEGFKRLVRAEGLIRFGEPDNVVSLYDAPRKGEGEKWEKRRLRAEREKSPRASMDVGQFVCDGSRHRIAWWRRGPFVALDHTVKNLEAMATLREMGHQNCACLKNLDEMRVGTFEGLKKGTKQTLGDTLNDMKRLREDVRNERAHDGRAKGAVLGRGALLDAARTWDGLRKIALGTTATNTETGRWFTDDLALALPKRTNRMNEWRERFVAQFKEAVLQASSHYLEGKADVEVGVTIANTVKFPGPIASVPGKQRPYADGTIQMMFGVRGEWKKSKFVVNAAAPLSWLTWCGRGFGILHGGARVVVDVLEDGGTWVRALVTQMSCDPMGRWKMTTAERYVAQRGPDPAFNVDAEWTVVDRKEISA